MREKTRAFPILNVVMVLISVFFIATVSDHPRAYAQNPTASPPSTDTAKDEPTPVLAPDSVIAIQKLQIQVLSKENAAKDLAIQYANIRTESAALQAQLVAATTQALKDAKADPTKWQVDPGTLTVIPIQTPRPVPAKK